MAAAIGIRVALLGIAKDAHRRFLTEAKSVQRHVLTTVLSNCSWKHKQLSAMFRKPFDIMVESCREARELETVNGRDSALHTVWLPGPDSNQRPIG